MENTRYPQIKIFDAARAANDKVINVLLVCVDAGSLPSLAIWDSPKKPTDFTVGRGYHFCHFTARNDEEIQQVLDVVQEELANFCEAQATKELSLKGRNLKISARPTPPQP